MAGTLPSWAIVRVVSNGVVMTLGTGSLILGTPAGVVIDFQGNVYLTDTTNNQIVKLAADGVTASVLSITGISPALSSPKGLAIDSAGNLYIADTGNSRIVKVSTSGSGSIISTPSVTLNAPQGVAVDGSGNIYISNTNNNQLVKVPSDGSSASTDLTGSLAGPRGITVDPLGNLYVADTGNSRVVKVNATSPFSSGSINATVTAAAGVALDSPSGVTIGNNGVLYIADTNTTESGHPTPGRVVIVDSQGNASQLLNGNPVFNSPMAVAVSAMGNIYVVDSGGTSNAGRIQSFQSYTIDNSDTFTSSVNFGHVQLGSAGTSISIPISVSEITTLSSINVYTNGTQNLDFTIANASTCAAATTNTDCTVDVSFVPTAAGIRKGDLVLNYTLTEGPPRSLTVPIYGIADAPVAVLSPSVASVFNVGTASVTTPFQQAVDGAGNIYVSSYSSNHVIAIPAGGGSGTTVNTGSFTISQPTGLALDAAGNLFIADYGNSRIVKVATGGTASLFAISGLSMGISFPTALAFDGAGNLYITDYGNGRIVEVNPYGQGTVLATGSFTFSSINITGTAVDAIGNVYIADRNNNRIVKVDPLGNATLLSLPSLTLSDPQGVAVDPNGNVYVMDSGHERIIQIAAGGAISVMSFSGVTIGSTIFGITPDANGNILVGDWQSNRLVKINVGQSALTFADTNTGETSSDSPKTATVTNLGDQPLVFSANPSFTANFSEPTGDPNPCSSSTTLAAGTGCEVPVDFAPQAAGSLNANITVTNNTLNVANSTQQIAVSGTGINAGDTTSTVVSISPSAAVYGQALTIVAKVTDTATGRAADIPSGSVSFVDTIGTTVTQLNNGAAVTLEAAGNATLTNVVLPAVGPHTITAHYAGVSSTYLSSSGTGTIALSKASVTITGPSSTVSVAVDHAVSIPVTVTGSYTTLSVPSGSIAFTILNSTNATASSGTATLTASSTGATATVPVPSTLASGSYTVAITYPGDTNYLSSSAATNVTLQVGLTGTAVSLASSVNPSLLTSAVTFTATLSSSGGTPTGNVGFYDGTTLLGTVALSSGSTAFTTATLTTGTHSITAAYSGDGTFQAGNSVPVSQLVQDFTLSTPTSSTTNGPSATVVPGGTATYSLFFGPSAGTEFPAPVTLSLSGLPPGATGTLSPSTLPAGSGLTQVTLTIQLPATTTASLHRGFAWATPVLALFLLPFAGRMRRGAKALQRCGLVLIVLAAGIYATAGLTGCASKATGFFGQAEQTYHVVITATSGVLSHSTSVTLTVQ